MDVLNEFLLSLVLITYKGFYFARSFKFRLERERGERGVGFKLHLV